MVGSPNWFVGLPVPAGSWFEPLLEDIPDGARVFHQDDLHITVAFLGRVTEDRAFRCWSSLESYKHEPLDVRLSTVAPMGNHRRPSALSVLLVPDEGCDETATLIGTLRGPLFELGEAEPDRRPPKPHLTVARPSRSAKGSTLRTLLAWAESRPSLGVKISLDGLALYTWSEDRRERQFRQVAYRRLDGVPL